ncbi:glucans biosynthesis glucosyltransferase MdoH [Pseudomonas sp.]|uniref:glucans biosynthesis glucosyltransferase MdoH n=1 Tax=Pseudomonas sp. TaxID=306 RepID=UPI0028AD8E65|nr:glucans biosynthesis glucosyltransferase MdoH [Pseudomonas sp.]
MSNSSARPESLGEYLAHLPLSDEQRAELASCTSFGELHQRLAARPAAHPTEAVQASVGPRLTVGSAAELEDAEMLGVDGNGRLCLKIAPPIKRTKVVPEPWRTNVLIRMWRRLTGRPNAPQPPKRELPAARWRTVGSIRRYILLTLMIGQTIVAGWYMKGILPYQGWSFVDFSEIVNQPLWDTVVQVWPYALQTSILILFGILFCWVSAGFWTFESVAASGNLDRFDFFVLSDTNDTDIAVAEQQAWLDVCRETKGFGRIFYRRRRRRVKRKSGNLDDFCRRWGGDYKYMVVLDADSVMSGECLSSLVRLMEANPDAGIIQTGPKASGMDTLYARMQQFATRVYGPLFTAGLHFWQLGESHYWGHNAIIRMKPFIEHCALAPLPGKGAFAGAILSHDFVEAALMRRAGWGVWIAYDLPGSYEELPPNLLDELKRDRRWCHGNLMNFRLFLVKGMHPVHRAVFLTGVMSYLSAPLWFLFLVLSTALLATNTLMEPQYFIEPYQLYPLWPQWHPEKAVALFSTTIVLLFLPKLLSVILIWAKGAVEYGGRIKVTLSMLMEMLFSMLLAPVRMIFHTRFVLAAFLGWAATWNSPQRDDDSTPWSEAVRRHGPQTLLGFAWAALVAWLNPSFLWWLAPIVGSLLLSIPVSVISSRTRLGLAAKDEKLFLIPEEYATPQELLATDQYTHENRWHALHDGFVRAVVDPRQNALACAMATARHGHAAPIEAMRVERVAKALEVGPQGLDLATRLALLSDPVALSRLHEQVWAQHNAAWIDVWRASISNDPHAPLLPLHPENQGQPTLAGA